MHNALYIMSYYYKQLENKRWGIFIEGKLVASIGCVDTCKKIVQFLENRFRDRDKSNFQNRTQPFITSYFHDIKLRP